MTTTEKQLKQLMVQNNFKQHLMDNGKWFGYADDKISITEVRQLIAAALDYLCEVKRMKPEGEDAVNFVISWYQKIRVLFPSKELFEEFVAIVDANKCDYIPHHLSSTYKEYGYTNDYVENKWWSI